MLSPPLSVKLAERIKTPKNEVTQGALASIPASVKIEPVTDGKLHDLYIVTEPLGEDEVTMALISIELKAE